jgi:hypothetical protein
MPLSRHVKTVVGVEAFDQLQRTLQPGFIAVVSSSGDKKRNTSNPVWGRWLFYREKEPTGEEEEKHREIVEEKKQRVLQILLERRVRACSMQSVSAIPKMTLTAKSLF